MFLHGNGTAGIGKHGMQQKKEEVDPDLERAESFNVLSVVKERAAAAAVANTTKNEKETEAKRSGSFNILSVVVERLKIQSSDPEENEIEPSTSTGVLVGQSVQGGQPPQQQSPTTPGAYRGAPGTTMDRIEDKINFSLVRGCGPSGLRQTDIDPLTATTTSSTTQEIETPNTTENLGTREKAKDKKWSPQCTTRGSVVVAVVVACIVFTVSLSVGLANQKSVSHVLLDNETPDHDNDHSSSNGTLQKQLELAFGAKPAQQLPPETILSIIQSGNSKKKKSPQLMALEWLVNDPQLNRYGIPQKRQRLALASLYFATNGPKWFASDAEQQQQPANNQWLDYGLHECEWFSLARSIHGMEPCHNNTVLTNDHRRHEHVDYKSLVLRGASNKKILYPSLQGTLPPQLALLTNLEVIDVGYQKLKGSIPTQIDDMLVPAFPPLFGESYSSSSSSSSSSELGAATTARTSSSSEQQQRWYNGLGTLRSIVLEHNFFTGTIPQSFYEYGEVIRLNHNKRLEAGTIPTTIGNNKRLIHLSVMETNRVGSIPTELFLVSTLQQILFNKNQFTGTIPSQIGRLSSTLQHIDFEVNRFDGTLPTQIGVLSKLENMMLGVNEFTGTLSSQMMMMNLTSLQNMEVANNQLSGSIPSQIGTLTKLSYVNLGHNSFSGIIPTSLSQLSRLQYLYLYNNLLTGTLRPELLLTASYSNANKTVTSSMVESTTNATTVASSWPNLETLDLSANSLEGSLPSELGLLHSLQYLNLRDNNFVSQLPEDLKNLKSIQEILLDATEMSGSIPEIICSLPIETFQVECNRLDCPVSCECICM